MRSILCVFGGEVLKNRAIYDSTVNGRETDGRLTATCGIGIDGVSEAGRGSLKAADFSG
jgi:hypothetical protein